MERCKAIIVDLDGTLYDNDKRRDLYMRGKWKNFNKFHEAAKDDPPNAWCVELVLAMFARGYTPLFVSGRDDQWRCDTIDWIDRYLPEIAGSDRLYMRVTGDTRPDNEVKLEIYRNAIEPFYDVLFCVDDRQKVVDMWRSIGLTCLQCGVGNF